MTKINLTDEEWMSILDQTRDGLPYCCANLSALRDDIASIVRYGCEISDWHMSSFVRHYCWVFPNHELPLSPIHKILRQLIHNDENAMKLYRSLIVDNHQENINTHLSGKEMEL